MARLIVIALSEDTVAVPGNRLSNYICVSITEINGNPIVELTEENFKVDPMIAAPGGATVHISSFFAGRLLGFYYLNLVPVDMKTWKHAFTYLQSLFRKVMTEAKHSRRY